MLHVDQAVAKSWACLDQQGPEVIEVLLVNQVVALKGRALAQQQAIFVQTQMLHIPMAHYQSHHGLAAAGFPWWIGQTPKESMVGRQERPKY